MTEQQNERGLRPIPDPTILTTEQLLREIGRLDQRMTDLLQAGERIVEEKFHSVTLQFALVERQRVEQKVDTKSAVDAALIAQKEAVREQTTASERAIAKSEAATAKQIEQNALTFTTAIGGLAEIVADLKDRVGRIESVKQGGRDTYAAIYALAGFVLTVLVIGGIVSALIATR